MKNPVRISSNLEAVNTSWSYSLWKVLKAVYKFLTDDECSKVELEKYI